MAMLNNQMVASPFLMEPLNPIKTRYFPIVFRKTRGGTPLPRVKALHLVASARLSPTQRTPSSLPSVACLGWGWRKKNGLDFHGNSRFDDFFNGFPKVWLN